MARKENQKLKLLYLLKILTERTDAEHSLTMQQLIDSLAEDGIEAERKSLYSDLDALRDFGFDIIGEKCGRQFRYSLGARRFELAELKLLVDAVQSSKFITEQKSRDLIRKLESFASRYEASQLSRQVFVSGRVKTMNESIFYNVDTIHEAIGRGSRIAFLYYNWNTRGEQVARRDGEKYRESPWALCWDDEYYYLIAYDSEEKKVKHFRVDKMRQIEILGEKREGEKAFEGFDAAAFSKKTFGMFGGRETLVTLECANEMAGVIIDRFGSDIRLLPAGEDRFRVAVRVAVSPQFFGGIIGLGEGVRIAAPKQVTEQMKEEIRRLAERYQVGTGL